MTMDVDKRVLVDTNVFVHAFIQESDANARARSALLELRTAGMEICISHQIVREFLAACTRMALLAGKPLRQDVINYVRELVKDCSYANEDERVSSELSLLAGSHQVSDKQIHDLNLIATMKVHGIPTLLTDNIEDLRRYRDEVNLRSI